MHIDCRHNILYEIIWYLHACEISCQSQGPLVEGIQYFKYQLQIIPVNKGDYVLCYHF